MTHIHTLYLALLLSLLVPALFSCSNPQPQATELLVRAEELMEDHPDSALVVIDSIFYPEKSLKKEQYMRYQVVRVQARNKNYLPVAEDILIFEAGACNFLTEAAVAQKDFEIQQKYDVDFCDKLRQIYKENRALQHQ